MYDENIKKKRYAQINVDEKTENIIRYLAKSEGKTIVQTLSQLFEHFLIEIASYKDDGEMNIEFKHTDDGLLIKFSGNSSLEFRKCSEREFNAMLDKERFP